MSTGRARTGGAGPPRSPRRSRPWAGRTSSTACKDEIAEDRIGTIAAGTTFFVLLALFPALGALVSLYGLIADPVTINEHLNDLRGYLPAAVLDLVGQELTRLEQTRTGALGVGFVGGLLVALWSANSGMKALFDALNVAYDETEKRGFFKLNSRLARLHARRPRLLHSRPQRRHRRAARS